MMDITRLSSHYDIRVLDDSDVDEIFRLYRQNPLFYKHTDARPTREKVLHDMTITPPGITQKDKYFFGFFENRTLIAVMDLVDGYRATYGLVYGEVKTVRTGLAERLRNFPYRR